MTTEATIETPLGKVDIVRQDNGTDNEKEFFWDLFDEKGNCLNEGEPFWEKPTEATVLGFLQRTPA